MPPDHAMGCVSAFVFVFGCVGPRELWRIRDRVLTDVRYFGLLVVMLFLLLPAS